MLPLLCTSHNSQHQPTFPIPLHPSLTTSLLFLFYFTSVTPLPPFYSESTSPSSHHHSSHVNLLHLSLSTESTFLILLHSSLPPSHFFPIPLYLNFATNLLLLFHFFLLPLPLPKLAHSLPPNYLYLCVTFFYSNCTFPSLAKVSYRKNSILLNPFYSGICIRTKQGHSDLIRNRTKDSYPNESEVELRIPIRFNPL